MKNNVRKLTLCRSSYSGSKEKFPYVLIKGKWFRDYGFSPGDQVIITNPEPHTLLMSVHRASIEMNEVRKKKCG